MPVIKHVHVVTPSLLRVTIVEDVGPLEVLQDVADPPLGDGVISITGITDNGSGKVRITAASFPGFSSNHMLCIWGTNASGVSGPHVGTVVSATQVDLLKVNFPAGYTYPGGAKFFVRNTDSKNYDYTATNPRTNAPQRFRWVGDGLPPQRQWMRSVPTRLATGWNVAANWGVTGKTVTGVKRFNYPLDSWHTHFADNSWGTCVHYEHWIYLSLNTPLTVGTSTITVTPPAATSVAAANFVFNDKKTRCAGLHVGPRFKANAASKTAYLEHWVPGLNANGGSVDYAALIAGGYKILNEGGRIVHQGSITLRKAWNSEDTTISGANNFRGHSNYGGPVRNITNVTLDSGNYLITYAPGAAGDLAENQNIAIGEVQGVRAGGASVLTDVQTFYHVRNHNGTNKTFNIGYHLYMGTPGTLVTATTPSPYEAGTGKIWEALTQNIVSADTYEMDFTSFQPTAAGQYYIQVPGLGVSEPFLVDNACNFDTFQAYMEADFNQRHYQVFNGTFGARTLQSPKSDRVIYKTKMIPWLCSEFFAAQEISNMGLGGRAVQATQGTNTTWYDGVYTVPSGTRMACNADAGDNDSFSGGYHWDSGAAHMITWLMAPTATRNVRCGLPTMEATWGSGWAGLDAMGDLLNSALNMVLGLRGFKDPTSKLVSAGLQQAHTTIYDPWHNTPGDWYVYKPDHISTYHSAGMKWMAAHCLKELGIQLAGTAQTTLNARATELEAEALEEWNAAEAVFASQAAKDAIYDAALTLAGFTAGEKTTFYTSATLGMVVWERRARAWAAACAFLDTGTTTYRAIFDGTTNLANDLANGAVLIPARMAYYLAANGTPAIRTQIEANSKTLIENFYLVPVELGGTTGCHYKIPRYLDNGINYGQAGFGTNAQHLDMLFAYYAKYVDLPRTLKAISEKFAYQHGGNPLDQSYTTGIGHNPTEGVLHNDMHALGISAKKWRGLGMYGPHNHVGRIISTAQLNPWNPMATEIERVPRSGVTQGYIDNFVAIKDGDTLDPPMHARPVMRKFFAVRDGAVEFTEYTQQENLGCNANLAFILHAYDGSTQNAIFGGRKRFIANAA